MHACSNQSSCRCIGVSRLLACLQKNAHKSAHKQSPAGSTQNPGLLGRGASSHGPAGDGCVAVVYGSTLAEREISGGSASEQGALGNEQASPSAPGDPQRTLPRPTQLAQRCRHSAHTASSRRPHDAHRRGGHAFDSLDRWFPPCRISSPQQTPIILWDSARQPRSGGTRLESRECTL